LSSFEQAERAADRFAVEGSHASVRPVSSGHIHDSYVVTCAHAGGERRFLLQRINEAVFGDCDALMENVSRVTGHLACQARQDHDGAASRCLSLVPTVGGDRYYRDASGAAWRMYAFLDGTVSFETPPDAARAYEAAKAFGAFQADLIDLPGPRLHETIPGFHDTTARYEAFERAIEEDRVGRAASVMPEIGFARAHRGRACAVIERWRGGGLPERVVHNDAKIGNVRFDLEGRSWVCVVDLDTVMAGLVLFDFGDMVRSMTCFAAEDATDLSRVDVNLEMFEAVARGYVESTRSFLSRVEREGLVAGGIAITLEQGVRFLADHLAGDRYYATSRAGHNLDRARVQFTLAESLIRRAGEMERIVASSP
jgi:hypothetical protein